MTPDSMADSLLAPVAECQIFRLVVYIKYYHGPWHGALAMTGTRAPPPPSE